MTPERLALALVLVGCRGDYDASTSSAEASTSTSSAEASTSTSSTSSAEASTSIGESSDTGPGCSEPYGPCSEAGECCEGVCALSNAGGSLQWCASSCDVAGDCPQPAAGAPTCELGRCTLRCDELGPSPDCPPPSTCNGYACGW